MIRTVLIFAAIALATVSSMGLPSQDCGGELKCPQGYKLFQQRKNGPWCMKVFPGKVTWWEAERQCRCSTKNAHLSGVESLSEKKFVEEKSQDILDNISIKTGSVWIGAYRRQECVEKTSKNEKCSDEKLFQFTDHQTCGTFIWQNWASGQPNKADSQQCAAILVSTQESGVNADNSGLPLSKDCLRVSSVGFVCGVAPIESGGSNYGGGEIMVIGAGKPEPKP
uniref:C-type lectin domain-containing protein n=1 Tax=Caenorhabditis japonica TaxID=281687 RepID=A0A8R1DHD6_CAEJA